MDPVVHKKADFIGCVVYVYLNVSSCSYPEHTETNYGNKSFNNDLFTMTVAGVGVPGLYQGGLVPGQGTSLCHT